LRDLDADETVSDNETGHMKTDHKDLNRNEQALTKESSGWLCDWEENYPDSVEERKFHCCSRV